MTFRDTEAPESRQFDGSNLLFSAANRTDPLGIGRVRFAADRAQTGTRARVAKRTAGGGVTHA